MVFENAVTGVFLISVAISFVISLLYKVLMDQEELKEIKEKMNELQEKSKEAREEGNEEEAMEYTQKTMKHSKKQMKMQFKPMMATFIIIIPIFWFVMPGLYPSATVNLAETNTLEYGGLEKTVTLENEDPLEVTVDGETLQENGVVRINDHRLKLTEYRAGQEQLEFSRVAVQLPVSLPFWGSALGWLGWYILISLGVSQVFRKLMGARP
ncbi:MAG: DUF2208 family protein [Candidatus Aenigmatarchaeota archaeon]